MKEKKVANYITDALFELLKTKELSDITATEVIAKAGVCRSSYYRNFYLLEDVIRQYGRDLFSKISCLPPVSLDDILPHMTQVYAHYLAERERLALLEKRGLIHIVEESLYDHCRKQIQYLSGFRSPYQVDFYAGASIYLTRAWIRNGFPESPEELAQITYHSIVNVKPDSGLQTGPRI